MIQIPYKIGRLNAVIDLFHSCTMSTTLQGMLSLICKPWQRNKDVCTFNTNSASYISTH